MTQIKYKDIYNVRSYEVDTNLDALFTSISNYIQDIAGRHAEMLGFGFDDMMRRKQYWVLSRLKINMKTYPKWKDKVIIETWPSGIDRLFANRNFRIFDGNEKLIGDAISCWLIISQENRRPQNPEWVGEQVPALNSLSQVKSLEKIPSVEDRSDPSFYSIKYSDLDQNKHVNNVKYIKYILDSYPEDFCANNRIITFEINFLSESSLGDQIGIKRTGLDQAENVFHHTLFQTENNKEICRARITWERHG